MKRNGFTLIEMLVVLIILLVIVGLALPAYNGARQRSIVNTVKIDLVKITDACTNYKMLNGHYPVPVWPLGIGEYGMLSKSVLDIPDVRVNQNDQYVDAWGKPFFYYPLPVSPKVIGKPLQGYTPVHNAILAHPQLTGGLFSDYMTIPSDTLNMTLHDKWMARSSQLRDVGVLIISGGPDKQLAYSTAYGVLNGTDFGDDLCNFKEK